MWIQDSCTEKLGRGKAGTELSLEWMLHKRSSEGGGWVSVWVEVLEGMCRVSEFYCKVLRCKELVFKPEQG